VSRLGRALAGVVVRLHPMSWRLRYGDEVADLVDESDSTLTDAVDLVRSALREHMNGGAPMRFEPARRHPTAFALAGGLALVPTLAVVALSLIGHELGVSAVAVAVDPWIAWLDTVRPLDLALVVAPMIALLLAVIPLVDLRIEREAGDAAIALRLRALTANLVIAAVALLVGMALIGHIVSESVLQAAGT